jgi:ribosomal protein S18
VSTSKQRLLSKAIKKARTLALISPVGKMRW